MFVYATVYSMAPLVPLESRTLELFVKRSRFIAKAEKVSSPEEVKPLVRRRREEHPGCSHVVWAFVTGPPKSRTMGLSDDGEPKGTAGRPVLEVLKGSGITDTLVTVVRFFGGTKLGTGGLVRAYSDAARGVLENIPTEELIPGPATSCRLSLPVAGAAERVAPWTGSCQSGD